MEDKPKTLFRREQYHVAERFNSVLVLKHTLRRWQAARARIQVGVLACIVGGLLTAVLDHGEPRCETRRATK